MSIEKKVKGLYEKKEKILKIGGEEKIAKQYEKGKLTARERIEKTGNYNIKIDFEILDAIINFEIIMIFFKTYLTENDQKTKEVKNLMEY